MENHQLIAILNKQAKTRGGMIRTLNISPLKLDRFMTRPEEGDLTEEDRQKLIWWAKGYYVQTSTSDGYVLRLPQNQKVQKLPVLATTPTYANTKLDADGNKISGGKYVAGTPALGAKVIRDSGRPLGVDELEDARKVALRKAEAKACKGKKPVYEKLKTFGL